MAETPTASSPPASAAPAAIPGLRRVHHVALICSDYPRSKRFYTEVLGLRVLAETWREARRSWKLDLALPDGTQLELFSFPDAPARPSRPEAQGLRHLAFVVDDLDASLAALQAQGVAVEPVRVDELTGQRFTFFADPDDLPIELVEGHPAAPPGLRRATGHFEVRITPLEAGDLPASAGRMRIEKTFHGALAGTSRGEMLTGGDPARGTAGYVALEVVDGVLDGRRGGFALQHHGAMDAAGARLSIEVVPGSGTGELAGIEGRLDLQRRDGRHDYVLSWRLP